MNMLRRTFLQLAGSAAFAPLLPSFIKSVEAVPIDRNQELLNEIADRMKFIIYNYQFEPNDDFTRGSIQRMMWSYLQSKSDVYDFLAMCDATNNTPVIIDNNDVRLDVYLKPLRSISTYHLLGDTKGVTIWRQPV